MNTLYNLFQKFIKRPDYGFFYLFLISFPFSIRKIIYSVPINGSFNESTSTSLFISDIFLLLTLLSWFYVLCNNNSVLSNIESTYLSYSQNNNVPRGTFEKFYPTFIFKKTFAQVIHNKYIVLWLILAIWSLLSTLWADDNTIALFKSIKIFEFIFLATYVFINVPRGTFMKNTFTLIILSGIINSIIGFLQFINKGSLGLSWLKESIFTTNSLNTAKILLNDDLYIRAYGLFPHPNILGGFLVFSIIISIIYYKMFHVEHFNQISNNKCSTWNILYGEKLFKGLFIPIQLIALILTFSKSAILSLVIVLIYISTKNVPRGTFLKIKTTKILLSLIAIILTLLLFKPNYNSLIERSVNDRISFINVSRGTFMENPLIGIGPGQNVINLIDKKSVMDWQYEPIHNVFLLIWLELGLFGLILFMLILYILVKDNNVPRLPSKMFHVEHFCQGGTLFRKGIETNKNRDILHIYTKSILIAFIIIMLFDHYLWDIQQGQILLFIVIGLLLATKQKNLNLTQ